MKKSGLIGKLITYLVGLGIVYYLWLPPLNIQATQFWLFLGGAVLAAAFLFFGKMVRVTKILRTPLGEKEINTYRFEKSFLVLAGGVLATAVILAAVGFVGSSQILHAGAHARLIDKQQNNFADDVNEIPYNRIPTVDRDTSIRLGNRKMGEVVELVSQFTVSDEYTQINYCGNQVRVSPLQYASLIKWFTNQREGIPYYMQVDMIDGSAELMKSKEPLRYTKSERFNRNLLRHLRFQYPFKLFYNSNFEVDDEGTPYWVTPVYKMQIGLFGGPDVKEVILTNVSTGESTLYPVAEVPEWVDVVYEANLILQQINWNGKYQKGFINSIIGQKGVLAATKGYNYLALKDDVFLYTGITSVSADESNIGFVLVNMRNKECNFYSCASAEEFSAMGSAEGAVQEKKYNATFPLLINVNGRPTYFLSLKDEAGLIKMYAFIDAANYQNVVTGTSVMEAYKAFSLQQASGTLTEEDNAVATSLDGVVSAVEAVVIDGNTIYYFMLEGDDTVYMAPATLSERLPFLKPGETVQMDVLEGTNTRRVKGFAGVGSFVEGDIAVTEQAEDKTE